MQRNQATKEVKTRLGTVAVADLEVAIKTSLKAMEVLILNLCAERVVIVDAKEESLVLPKTKNATSVAKSDTTARYAETRTRFQRQDQESQPGLICAVFERPKIVILVTMRSTTTNRSLQLKWLLLRFPMVVRSTS